MFDNIDNAPGVELVFDTVSGGKLRAPNRRKQNPDYANMNPLAGTTNRRKYITENYNLDPNQITLDHTSRGLQHITDKLYEMAAAETIDYARLTGVEYKTLILKEAATQLETYLGLTDGETAICPYGGFDAYTHIVDALSETLPSGGVVSMLSTEPEDTIMAWQPIAKRRPDISVKVAPLRAPIGYEDVENALRKAIDPDTTVFIGSLISRSLSMRLPVNLVRDLCDEHSVMFIADASYAVGVDNGLISDGRPDVVFGDLFRWLSVSNPTGFVWVSDPASEFVRPSVLPKNAGVSCLQHRMVDRGVEYPIGGAMAVQQVFASDLLDGGRVVLRDSVDGGLCRMMDRLGEGLAGVGLWVPFDGVLLAGRMRTFVVPERYQVAGVTGDVLAGWLARHGVHVRVLSTFGVSLAIRVSVGEHNVWEDCETLVLVLERLFVSYGIDMF